MFQTVSSTSVTSFVRVPVNDPAIITKMLDIDDRRARSRAVESCHQHSAVAGVNSTG
jgi:2-keto-3-deoxy-L-rhamnonate aldolase RhmA